MEDLSMQIVEGIAQAINGEGASEMMMEDIGIDKDGAINVLLADMPQERLSELVAEVHDRISHWRVNPFSAARISVRAMIIILFFMILFLPYRSSISVSSGNSSVQHRWVYAHSTAYLGLQVPHLLTYLMGSDDLLPLPFLGGGGREMILDHGILFVNESKFFTLGSVVAYQMRQQSLDHLVNEAVEQLLKEVDLL